MSFYGYGLGFPNLTSFGYTGYPSASNNKVTSPVAGCYGEESQARKDFKFFAGIAIAGLVIGALLRGKPNQAKDVIRSARREGSLWGWFQRLRMNRDTFHKTAEETGKKTGFLGHLRRRFKKPPVTPPPASGAAGGAAESAGAAGEAKKPGFFRSLFGKNKPAATVSDGAAGGAAESAGATGEAKKHGFLSRLFGKKPQEPISDTKKKFDRLSSQYKKIRRKAVDSSLITYDSERKLYINSKTLQPFSGYTKDIKFTGDVVYTLNSPMVFERYIDGKKLEEIVCARHHGKPIRFDIINYIKKKSSIVDTGSITISTF